MSSNSPTSKHCRLSTAPTFRRVVGVGSPHGADRAGWLVADRLAEPAFPDRVIHKASIPLDVLDWITPTDQLHLIDAEASPLESPGCYRVEFTADGTARLVSEETAGLVEGRVQSGIRTVSTDCRFEPAPHLGSATSHQIGLLETLSLAASLDLLPPRTLLWTVRFPDFEHPQTNGDWVQERADQCFRAIVKRWDNA